MGISVRHGRSHEFEIYWKLVIVPIDYQRLAVYSSYNLFTHHESVNISVIVLKCYEPNFHEVNFQKFAFLKILKPLQ